MFCGLSGPKNMCVRVFRLVLHYLNFTNSSLSRFLKLGRGIIDGFLLEPHYFYWTRPHFGGKLNSFVAVLAQNTCVGGCRSVTYYSKVYISLLWRFMKAGMGVMDNFILQPCHFLPSQSPFWRKTDKFFGWSGPKHMGVWLETGDIPLQLQYYFIIKVREAWEGNSRWISTLTSPFSISTVPTFEENWLVLWLLWPKTHVCVVTDPCYTIPKSTLVYWEGLWSLGWE